MQVIKGDTRSLDCSSNHQGKDPEVFEANLLNLENLLRPWGL